MDNNINKKIINNKLPWNGSHLGNISDDKIVAKWVCDGSTYYGLEIEPNKLIYCVGVSSKDLFPCIVDEIKVLFGIEKRGIHRINIGTKEYILYYIPISVDGIVIIETPLSFLDKKDPIRKDEKFKNLVQKIIVFCDILALSNTIEHSIKIRPGYIPINTNCNNTTITKSSNYDYSIITKTLFTNWFGEETSISSIVKQMVGIDNIPDNEIEDKLPFISANIRNQVEIIIKKYDINYVWYSNFIVDRLSRQLLL